MTVFTLVFSAMCDRFGRKRMILSIYSFWFIWAFVFFILLQTKVPSLIFLGIGVATLLTSAYGPIGSFVPEQFSSSVRYSGASLSVHIGSIIGGGFGPMLASILYTTYGITAVSFYICIIAAISICSTLALK